jgi:hypothetical protein
MENINIKKTGKGIPNLFHIVAIMAFCLANIAGNVHAQVSATITYTRNPQDHPFESSLTVPGGLKIKIEAWGGGGGGGGASSASAAWGGGGGGGAYIADEYYLTSASNFAIRVGGGGYRGGAEYGFNNTYAHAGEKGGDSYVVTNGITFTAGGGQGGSGGRSTQIGFGGNGGVASVTPSTITDVIMLTGGRGETGSDGNLSSGGGSPYGGSMGNGNSPGGGGSGGRVGPGTNFAEAGKYGALGEVRFTVTANPVISSGGTTEIVCGADVTLAVENSIVLNNFVEYQWYKDGTEIFGATGSTYQASSAGKYHATVTWNILIPQISINVYPSISPMPPGQSLMITGGKYALSAPSNNITLTANPVVSVNNMSRNVCSENNLTFSPVNGTDGLIPAGTTYMWTVATPNSNIGGVTGGNSGNTSVIDLGTLTNSTSTNQTVIYNVVPTNDPCQGNAFQLTVTVLPFPVISNIEQTVCNGENIFVPTGTSPIADLKWTWVIRSNSGVVYNAPNNVMVDSNGADIISIGTVSNTTNAVQTIVFDVKPSYASQGCSGSGFELKVHVSPNPQVLLVSDDITCCVGESVLLTANALPDDNYEYNWYCDNVLVASGNSNTHVSSGLAARATGYQYYVVVRSATGCGAGKSNTVALTVTNPQTAIVTLNYTDICVSGTIRATANIAQPENYTFTWFLDGVEKGYGQQFASTGLPTGAHSLKVEATPVPSCPGCVANSATVAFTVHADPVINISTTTAVVCGGNTAVVKVSNIALNAAVKKEINYTWQWAVNGTTVEGAMMESLSQRLDNPGVYQFSVRMKPANDVGCTSGWSTPVTVTVQEAPKVLLGSNVNICNEGDNVKLTATVTPSGTYTYEWYRDNVLIDANGGSTHIATGLKARATSYNYHVVARPASGCEGTSNDFAITVFVPQEVRITLNRSDICSGGVITATANIALADRYSYKWYLNNVEKGNGQQFTASKLPLGKQTLRVEATPSASCDDCEKKSATATFTVHPNPVVTIAADHTKLCQSGKVVLSTTGITLNAAVRDESRYTFQWAVNGTIINNAVRNSYSQTLEKGMYDFTMRMVQDDDCGCFSDWSAPVTVSVNESDMELPVLFIAGCNTEIINDYRLVQIPITVRSGNPQKYTITYADLSRSSFNHSGNIRRTALGETFIEARMPLQAGDYALIIDIDGCQYISSGRILLDSYALGGAKLIEQSWQDVLTVNNNPATNGGFTFYAYQWYKDNVLIPGATGQYYTEKEGRLNGSYHVELRGYAISASGQTTDVSFVSCPVTPLPQLRMAVYPVPAKVNQSLTLTASLTDDELTGATFEIYDSIGRLQRKITNLSPQITIEGFAAQGVYFGRLILQNNHVRDIKFVVTR